MVKYLYKITYACMNTVRGMLHNKCKWPGVVSRLSWYVLGRKV